LHGGGSGIRHSKTSAEVVNEKKGGGVFKWGYRMLGRDWNKAPPGAHLCCAEKM
jgi:hypothetical protein